MIQSAARCLGLVLYEASGTTSPKCEVHGEQKAVLKTLWTLVHAQPADNKSKVSHVVVIAVYCATLILRSQDFSPLMHFKPPPKTN